MAKWLNDVHGHKHNSVIETVPHRNKSAVYIRVAGKLVKLTKKDYTLL